MPGHTICFRRAIATASDPASEAQSKHHWVMVIDQSKCIGCNYCTYACKAVNDIPGNAQWKTSLAQAFLHRMRETSDYGYMDRARKLLEARR